MSGVSVNPPKTPVTKGSSGVAAATVPNICKMPGPPAPFVPTPLPNIGKSGDSPKDYSKKVKVEGQPVAIKGASFKSVGDIASKGTGGGLISSNTHGPTKFIGPGSFDVKIEGKSVQLLSDPMMNNTGPSGSPANAATLVGLLQLASAVMFTEQSNRSPTSCVESASHTWKIEEAKGKLKLDQKIADAAASRKKGTQFEARAATHNRRTGELQRSSQLSADGPNDEKVWAICSTCGRSEARREVDQVHDAPGGGAPLLVEVKSKPSLDIRDARQMGRNFQAVKQGAASGMIYKLPSGGGGSFVAGQIRKLADMAGVPVRIVRI